MTRDQAIELCREWGENLRDLPIKRPLDLLEKRNIAEFAGSLRELADDLEQGQTITLANVGRLDLIRPDELRQAADLIEQHASPDLADRLRGAAQHVETAPAPIAARMDESDAELLARLDRDPQAWAYEFCARFAGRTVVAGGAVVLGVDVDVGLMLTWFANAMGVVEFEGEGESFPGRYDTGEDGNATDPDRPPAERLHELLEHALEAAELDLGQSGTVEAYAKAMRDYMEAQAINRDLLEQDAPAQTDYGAFLDKLRQDLPELATLVWNAAGQRGVDIRAQDAARDAFLEVVREWAGGPE